MDTLPPEVLSLILRSIPPTSAVDVVKLRLISRKFNRAILSHLASLKHIFLSRRKSSKWSVTSRYGTHQVKSCEKALLIVSQEKKDDALSFITKKCPRVEAIDLSDGLLSIKLSHLVAFGGTLQYFKTLEVQIDVEFGSERVLVAKFPLLRAFDVGRSIHPFCIKLWAKSAPERFTQWQNTCLSGKCDVEDNLPDTKQTVLCLTVPTEQSIDLSLFAPKLRVLKISSSRMSESCSRFFFPELKYFSIIYSPSSESECFASHCLIKSLSLSSALTGVEFDFVESTNAVMTSILSLVSSSRKLLFASVTFFRLVNIMDGEEPLALDHCAEKCLEELNISINSSSLNGDHCRLVEHLLSSASCLNKVSVVCADKSIHMGCEDDSKMTVKLVVPGSEAALHLLDVLSGRSREINLLFIETERGLDESFVEPMLKFTDLSVVQANFRAAFMRSWLPRLSASSRKKPLKLVLCPKKLHFRSGNILKLLTQHTQNGTLSHFTSSCTCIF